MISPRSRWVSKLGSWLQLCSGTVQASDTAGQAIQTGFKLQSPPFEYLWISLNSLLELFKRKSFQLPTTSNNFHHLLPLTLRSLLWSQCIHRENWWGSPRPVRNAQPPAQSHSSTQKESRTLQSKSTCGGLWCNLQYLQGFKIFKTGQTQIYVAKICKCGRKLGVL